MTREAGTVQVMTWLLDPLAAALFHTLCCIHPPPEPPPGLAIAAAAQARTGVAVTYDPAYVALDFPGGDVADDRGVCADVVVRSLRQALGLDLQAEVHADMTGAFDAYPAARVWGQSRPDPNIDHRRVLNLEVWFTREGWALPLSDDPADFAPGDIVSWRLPGSNLPHIGVVSAHSTPGGARPLVVHNIGGGVVAEDVLFAFEMTGRFRAPGG